MLVEMEVNKVGSVVPRGGHVLLLKEYGGERIVVLGIGGAEAQAIALALQGESLPRPITHDLILDVMKRAKFTLESVTIHDIRDETFIAQLDVETEFGMMEIDARPSDAVALAVRANAAILCTEEVLESQSVTEEQLNLDD